MVRTDPLVRPGPPDCRAVTAGPPGARWPAGAPTTDAESSGQVRGGERDERHGSGGGCGQRHQQHGPGEQQHPQPVHADPQPAGGVVAQLGHPQRRRAGQQRRYQYREGGQQRCGVGPAATVEAAGEPEHRPGGAHQRYPGHQVAVDAGEDGRHADADQDQPVAVHAAPPGDQVDEQAGDHPAEGRGTGEGGTAAADGDHDERARGRALGEAEHVRAAQRVADQRLEDRSGQAERGAHGQSGDQPGQPQLGDDELLGGAAATGQRAQHVDR